MEDNNIIVLSFSDSKIPEFKEVRGKQWISFGEKNDYPDYLVKLYNKSAKHNAIINGKVNYIFGDGFYYEGQNESAKNFATKMNSAGETLNDIFKKCAIDIEIFGGFYLNIIPNKLGDKIAEIYHLDFNKVRANEDCSKFFYKNSWANTSDSKDKPKEYCAFDKKDLSKASVFQFKDYRPGLRTYPLPNYIGSVNYIESDMEISKHTLTNAKTGFSASKFINFFNGEPPPEMQRDIQKRFENKFTGSDGSKIIIGFNNDPAKAPQILDLGASDLTKEDFEKVDNLISQNIYAGHQITSPMLFGIQEPGKLGGRNELRVSYEIFNNTYVAVRQKSLEKVFNFLASVNKVDTRLMIRSVDPVGVEFTDQVLLAAAPRDWLLDKMGIDSNKYIQPPVGAPAPKPTEPAPAPAKMSKEYSEEEVAAMFDEVGEMAENFSKIFSRPTNFSADETEIITREAFVALKTRTQDESNILGLIQKDKRITPEVVAQTLKLDLPYVESVMEDLHHRGLVQYDYVIENGTKQTIRKLTRSLSQLVGEIKNELPEIFIRYTYEKAPEASGPSVLPTTRPFCARLATNGRMYSRADIEQISERVGYSVWDRRGGFWNHGHGRGTTAYCRHIWKSNVVIKKKS